jgi:hypothetical protein
VTTTADARSKHRPDIASDQMVTFVMKICSEHSANV